MTETNRSSGGIRRRTLLGWAPAGILAAGLSLANTPRANAAEYSTYELQMNLACFTHLTWVACDLTYEDADGILETRPRGPSGRTRNSGTWKRTGLLGTTHETTSSS